MVSQTKCYRKLGSAQTEDSVAQLHTIRFSLESRFVERPNIRSVEGANRQQMTLTAKGNLIHAGLAIRNSL